MTAIEFYVGDDRRRFESEGAAASLALTLAIREHRAQYVRSTLTERALLVVQPLDGGVYEIRKAG